MRFCAYTPHRPHQILPRQPRMRGFDAKRTRGGGCNIRPLTAAGGIAKKWASRNRSRVFSRKYPGRASVDTLRPNWEVAWDVAVVCVGVGGFVCGGGGREGALVMRERSKPRNLAEADATLRTPTDARKWANRARNYVFAKIPRPGASTYFRAPNGRLRGGGPHASKKEAINADEN